VELVVDLAPGAEHDRLARWFADAARAAAASEPSRREFSRLRGSVGVVADDTGTALTLRFDFGRLTIHEGLVGVPTVTLRGNTEDLERLLTLPLSRRRALGLLSDRQERRELLALLSALGRRRLKIYGLGLHAPLVLRILRVLSRQSGAAASSFDGSAAAR
jgi:hypothetical protein